VKYFIGACLSAFMFVACNNANSSTPAQTADSTKVKSDTPLVIGLYKGDFSGSPVYITINYARGQHVAGYNVHNGLRRNLSGTIMPSGDGFEVVLNEPGDHPYDGHFKLAFNKDFTTASGTWTPVNTSLKDKSLSVERQKNLYEDGDGVPGSFDGDHSDITFDADGSCTLNYYDKTSDSTYAGQMITVRGTWGRKDKDSVVTVNWQGNNPKLGKSTRFSLVKQKDMPEYNSSDYGDGDYVNTVRGAGFEFSLVED
jgi:hypothetical protein